MADKTPMEEAVRRAFDANVRYWETVGRATSDYLETVTKLWSEAPVTWMPGIRTRDARTSSTSQEEPASVPALLLQGPEGSTAQAVVMIRNDLGRDAEAPVLATQLRGPGGATIANRLKTEPETVHLPAGTQAPVTVMVNITRSMEEGVAYKGTIDVPGLSAQGVPVVVRRRD